MTDIDLRNAGYALDRRTLLASASALFLGGCVHCADMKAFPLVRTGQTLIGDAHAHLFNAADLPVAGFLKYVLLPEYLPRLKPLWPALIALSKSLKGLAISAEAEARQLFDERRKEAEPVAPARYADTIADEIEARTSPAGRAAALADKEAATETDSFTALAAVIDSAAGGPTGRNDPGVAQSGGAGSLLIDRRFLERVAVEGAGAVFADGRSEAMRADVVPDAAGGDFAVLWNGIKWLYDMVQPRCKHVHTYLATMANPHTHTDRIVNLLIDYDAWLGDSAASGSGIEQQLLYWTRYARSAQGRLAVETFAPYDPLRHVEERLKGPTGRDVLADVRRWASGGPGSPIAISGFKLYPPMGFSAAGNSGPPVSNRGGAQVIQRWTKNKWPLERCGALIEDALDTFFALCAEYDMPVIAHARDSNEASDCAGKKADPKFWLHRVKAMDRPLRISLGHFSPDDFGEQIYRDVLAYNRTGPSRISFDLSYSEAILNGKAEELLDHVARLCRAEDPDCQSFVFGTDWIMLGREPQAPRYIQHLWDAMEGRDFWKGPARDNLLHANLDRFLRRRGL